MYLTLVLALLLVTSCETRRERSRGEMTSKHRVKNLPPADSLQPAVCSNPVYCTPYGSMPWDITVAAHERMVGAAMKQAFGNDLGTIWETYLHRKYVPGTIYTGEKVRTLVDVTESIKSVSSSLITTNIEDQFRGDPTALDHNRRAVDTASFNAMRYIKCHPEQFPSFHTSPQTMDDPIRFKRRSSGVRGSRDEDKESSQAVPQQTSPARTHEGPWFEFEFDKLLFDYDDAIPDKPSGYVDMNFGGMDNTLYHAPSNLAGGVGGSDYGDDLRFFGGHLHCTKSMSVNDQPSVLCRSRVMLHVFDAIDFCPGQCGTGAEQLLTIAFSRLEASGLAYDIPLYVEVWMPVIEVNTILWEMSAEQCQSLFPSELHANELEGSLVVQTSFNSEDHERAAQAIINHRNEAKIYSAQGTIETIAEMLSE